MSEIRSIEPVVPQATDDDAPRCATTDRFGEFLTSRGHGVRGRVGAVMAALFMGGFGVAMVAAGVVNAKASPWMLVAGPVMGLLFVYAGVVIVIGGFRSWDFYERGLVREGPRHRLELPYLDVRWMQYQSVRQYHNGAYAGTQLTMKLGLANGSKLVVNFRHKERAKGFFRRRFEGQDEMEQVRDAVALCVAADLRLLLDAGKEIEWGGWSALTQSGIKVTRGKRRGTQFAWPSLREFWTKNNRLWIAAQGEPKSFVGIPISARNFYPGLLLFERLCEERIGRSIRRPEPESLPA